jgi:hypothetical protein
MNTKHIVHQSNGKDIVALKENGVVIHNGQDFLDVVMNLPSDRVIIYKENVPEEFFDLRSGLAGEILQKAVNYSRQLGIVGDLSRYPSKSLKSFVYESNKSDNVIFTDTLDEALQRLSA